MKQPYESEYYVIRKDIHWRNPTLVAAIMDVVAPISVLDVGCGDGHVLHEFEQHRIPVYGIEWSEKMLPAIQIARTKVMFADLNEPINLPVKFDLAVCFNVAEHLPETAADNLVRILSTHSNKVLFASVAVNHHPHKLLNCQPKDYWTEKFIKAGMVQHSGVTFLINKILKAVSTKYHMSLIYNNLIYMRHPE